MNIYFTPPPTQQQLESKETGDTVQNINIVDVICEGPIKGLVGGTAGVYLDDVSIEDAEFNEYVPTQTVASGTITFTGGATGTTDSNTSIPTNLSNFSTLPRTVVLSNYRETTVNLSNQSTASGTDKFTLTATSGTPFTGDWATKATTGRSATLSNGQQSVLGVLFIVNGSTATFTTEAYSGIDTSSTFTLLISESFTLSTINSSTSITLISAPAAGTYNFSVLGQQTFNDDGLVPFDWSGYSNKISNIAVQFRRGSLYQNYLREIGGVGGSVSILGSTSGINLPELKILSSTGETATGLTVIDRAGLPDGSTDTADAPTILDTSDFGLDTSAKITEADEVYFSI